MIKVSLVSAALLISGCAASTGVIGTTILPTSNKSIDVVLHRSDIKFLDCATLTVIQTYSSDGEMIDSAKAQGRALHCDVVQAGIQAAGVVGAGALVGKGLSDSGTSIKNNNSQGQGQYQGQGQIQGQSSTNVNVNKNYNELESYNVNMNQNGATHHLD
jgi:hypothetical protein